MGEMKVNAKLVQKISTRTGNQYVVLQIEIFKGVWKDVYLSESEIKLLEISTNANNKG